MIAHVTLDTGECIAVVIVDHTVVAYDDTGREIARGDALPHGVARMTGPRSDRLLDVIEEATIALMRSREGWTETEHRSWPALARRAVAPLMNSAHPRRIQ